MKPRRPTIKDSTHHIRGEGAKRKAQQVAARAARKAAAKKAKLQVPTLKIIHDGNGVPIEAHCSCGDAMPKGTPRVTTPELNQEWFEKNFRAHVAMKHHREDASQAAARIVREATENK